MQPKMLGQPDRKSSGDPLSLVGFGVTAKETNNSVGRNADTLLAGNKYQDPDMMPHDRKQDTERS